VRAAVDAEAEDARHVPQHLAVVGASAAAAVGTAARRVRGGVRRRGGRGGGGGWYWVRGYQLCVVGR
jgi:hypothetical protein